MDNGISHIYQTKKGDNEGIAQQTIGIKIIDELEVKSQTNCKHSNQYLSMLDRRNLAQVCI